MTKQPVFMYILGFLFFGSFSIENDTLPGILQQTTKYNESQVSSQIISFDMKILFLVTATRPEARYT